MNERLKNLRIKRKMTQGEIAAIIGVSTSTYCKYERGDTPPRTSQLLKLSRLFETSIDYLVGNSDICERQANGNKKKRK